MEIWQSFNLIITNYDYVGVKYVEEENVRHLINTLTTTYDVSTDLNGLLYCGIKLDWKYDEQYLHTLMIGYVNKQRMRYKHLKTSKPQNTSL